jgi:putative transposase
MPFSNSEKTWLRKKVRHFDEAGHAHFLTFSCCGRLALLSRDRTRWWFIDALSAARAKHQFDLWAWVIMPEHVHLLIWPRRRDYQTHLILADIKRPVGQPAVTWLEANCPKFLDRLTVRNRNRVFRRFWQAGPGQDHNVYEPATAHDIAECIHLNPVRRGLVARLEDWPWSSAADWMNVGEAVLKVDRTIPPVIDDE